jgi:hypothetical protein
LSNQAWALQVMLKYRLQVDFSSRTIDARGYTRGWYWGGDKRLYEALQEAVDDIERAS